MKPIFIFSLAVLFIQACSSDISSQIENVKWQDNYSKLGKSQAYTSFIDGEVKSCEKNNGQWKTIASYQVNNSNLTILPGNQAKEKRTFAITIKGSGESRILSLTQGKGEKKHEMAFSLSNTADCALK